MSKKQFTLDSWLKDKSQKVVTRCGYPVRIVCTDVKRKDYPILALVERDDQEEYQSFTKDGRFSLYNRLHDNFDLFIETADEVSEDEKIRKEIAFTLEYLVSTPKSALHPGAHYTVEEALAWLEKQGEHANFLSKIQIGDKVTRNEAGVLVNLSQLKRVAKPSEKQGEQEKDILEDAILDGNEDGLIAETIKYKNEKQGKQKFEMKTAEESLGISSDEYNKIVDECIFGEPNPTNKVEPKFKVGNKIYLKPEYRMPDDDTPIANTVKEIRRIDDKHYRFDGSYIFIEDQDKYELVEQKPKENKGNIGGISPNPEWSEEEEAVLDALIRRLEGEDIYVSPHLAAECLKSLKQRITKGE